MRNRTDVTDITRLPWWNGMERSGVNRRFRCYA